jgi:hypothetical protein
MGPLRLDRVEPRALHRQPAGHDPHTPLAPGQAVVGPNPGPHPLADVPGGVVPDQQQRRLPFRRQDPTGPFQEVLGDLAHRPSLHEPQQHPPGVAAQQPIAAQRLGVGILAGDLPLDQVQRLVVGPGVQPRQGQPTPPGLVGEAQHPVGVGRRQVDQSVAGFLLAGVGWVGAGDPLLGAPPADAEPLQRDADGLAGQLPRGPAAGMADLGKQLQGPQPGGLAAGARAVVQQILQGFGKALVQEGSGRVGSRGFLVQAGHPLAIEGVDGVADGAGGTAEIAGDLRGPQAVGTGQQDLAAPDGERRPGAKSRLGLLSLGGREAADKKWWFHSPLFGPTYAQTRPRLTLH